MTNLKNEILNECIKYAKENNETDLNKVIEIIMEKRLSFYEAFNNNFETNINKIDKELQKEF